MRAFLMVVLLSLLATTAQAGVICGSPALPPGCGAYVTPAQVHASYTAGSSQITLSTIAHFGFGGIVVQNIGLDEQEQFNSTVTGLVLVDANPPFPITLNGPVTTIVRNKVGNTTGTFDTEIVALSLVSSNPIPIQIRESPTLQSLGKTTITGVGGGNYRIDSFFDVFTELSLDGGQTWIPQNERNGTRVELQPEPSSVVLMGLGCVSLILWRRRRARAGDPGTHC